jgi:hypothetical protein
MNDVAVIRLQLVEHELTISNRQSVASDFADLETAVTAALAEDPNNSFLWLADYWLQDPSARAADRGLKFLHMSYLLGPNEAWIAVKRNPLALKTFSSLPSELEEQVVSEFVGLVRSGLYWDASNILAGSEPAVREKLLGELVRIREDNRVEFAKVLRRNLDDARVPGVSGPSSRGAF